MEEQCKRILDVIETAEDQSEFLLIISSLMSIARTTGFERSYTQKEALSNIYHNIKYTPTMTIDTARRIARNAAILVFATCAFSCNV